MAMGIYGRGNERGISQIINEAFPRRRYFLSSADFGYPAVLNEDYAVVDCREGTEKGRAGGGRLVLQRYYAFCEPGLHIISKLTAGEKMGKEKKSPRQSGRELLEKLGHDFANPALLREALTHSSFANESGVAGAHNERLEFLGDAVLELCVSSELFCRYPKAREGELTI